MKIVLALLVALLVCGLSTAAFLYHRSAGFTPWMTDMGDYLKPLEVKDAGGKNYWDHRHWLEAVEGRWHNGRMEWRLRAGDAPATGPYWWWWWFNQDAAGINRHILEMSDAGCTLVSFNSFTLPDGTVRYTGVWHRTTPDPRGN